MSLGGGSNFLSAPRQILQPLHRKTLPKMKAEG